MPDLSKFDRLYRQKLFSSGDSAATVTVKTLPTDPKTVRVLTHVAVENQTNAYTKLRIGIENTGEKYYLNELDTPAADELAVNPYDIVLGEADRFFAELTGTTDGDIILVTLLGWEIYK